MRRFLLGIFICAASLLSPLGLGTEAGAVENDSKGGIQLVCDPAVELLAVVYHLSGAQEYASTGNKEYDASIENWFSRFGSHNAVKLAKEFRDYGIGYDAVASFASHLDVSLGGEVLFDKSLIKRIDGRWSRSMQQKMLSALRSFCRESSFCQWYKESEPFRKAAMDEFRRIAAGVNVEWYRGFFGKRELPLFRITVAPIVGCNNYGLNSTLKDGREILTPVMGSLSKEILVHEFCHPFCNPIIDEIWPQISENAEKFFLMAKSILKRQAYGNARTMMYETFVRASVIRYFMDNEPNADIDALVREEKERGFLLVERLISAGASKEGLVEAVNGYSVEQYLNDKAAEDAKKIHYRCFLGDAEILKLGARENLSVPVGKREFKIVFDRAMKPDVSLLLTDVEFPPVEEVFWSADKRELVLILDLKEKNWAYGIHINGSGFAGLDGVVAVDAEVKFSTDAPGLT